MHSRCVQLFISLNDGSITVWEYSNTGNFLYKLRTKMKKWTSHMNDLFPSWKLNMFVGDTCFES